MSAFVPAGKVPAVDIQPEMLTLIEQRVHDYGEDPSVGIKPLHTVTLRQARKEMAAVGLVLDSVSDVLPEQCLMIFTRVEAPWVSLGGTCSSSAIAS